MLPILLLMNRMASRRRIARKTVKSVKPDKKAHDADYCRTCLSTEDLVAIFKESEKKRTEDLKLLTGLEIRVNDGLPQKIYKKCIEILHTCLQFRRTRKKSERTLYNMFYSKPNKSPVKVSKTPKSAKSSPKEDLKEALEDLDFDYGDVFKNDFQNDADISYQDDEVTLSKETEKPNLRGRKKPEIIPNAASHKCNTCSKEFWMKATYKAHMRFHTNYCVCESCRKRCRNNNQLQELKRARDGLSRIHKCVYCEYSSATKEALTIHERCHTGERPYVCDHCGTTFHRRSNLVQHIAIHLPEKNFQCDMCLKRLKSRKFQIHKHNAHTGKRLPVPHLRA